MMMNCVIHFIQIYLGNYGNSIVSLQYTSLTRFESGVFQPMLEKIEPYYTGSSSTAYVDIDSSE